MDRMKIKGKLLVFSVIFSMILTVLFLINIIPANAPIPSLWILIIILLAVFLISLPLFYSVSNTVWKTQKNQIGKKHPKKGFEMTSYFVIKSHIVQYTIYILIVPIIVLVYFSYVNSYYQALLFVFGFVLLLYLYLVLSEILAEKLHEN